MPTNPNDWRFPFECGTATSFVDTSDCNHHPTAPMWAGLELLLRSLHGHTRAPALATSTWFSVMVGGHYCRMDDRRGRAHTSQSGGLSSASTALCLRTAPVRYACCARAYPSFISLALALNLPPPPLTLPICSHQPWPYPPTLTLPTSNLQSCPYPYLAQVAQIGHQGVLYMRMWTLQQITFKRWVALPGSHVPVDGCGPILELRRMTSHDRQTVSRICIY